MRRILIHSSSGKREISDKELIAKLRTTAADIAVFIGHMSSTKLYKVKTEYGNLHVSDAGTVPVTQSYSYTVARQKLETVATQTDQIMQDMSNGTFDYDRRKDFIFEVAHARGSGGTKYIVLVGGTYQPHSVCPNCDGLFTKVGLKTHVGSATCITDALVKRASDDGYALVVDTALSAAIRTGDIDHRMVPSKLDVWAPKWVIEAAKLYRNGNYKDISLGDFIKNMQ